MRAHANEPFRDPCLPTADPSVTAGADPVGPDEFAFLKGLILGMRCGVLTIDTEGHLIRLNGHARRILDLESVPAAGTRIDSALAQHPRLVQALQGCFEMQSLPNRAELDLGNTAGATKTIGFTFSLVRTDDGSPLGAAMFFKDLTQIEQAEEQERLRDRLAALGEMAASTAHEIRNPLAAIDVSCKLLWRRLEEDDACRDLLEKIGSEIRRLNRAVDTNLRFVRPLRPSFAPCSLGALLAQAIESSGNRCGAEGVEIRSRLDPSIPTFLMDRELMEQVFVNLVLNARQAVGEQGLITIEADRIEAPEEASVPYEPSGALSSNVWSRPEQFVVVRVTDNGPGICADDAERIFYPFFTTKKQGSGVGLAMAKKIVASHRGTIGTEKAPGEGAVFVVRLPIVLASAEASSS